MRIGNFDILSSSSGALTLESAAWEGGRLLPGTGNDKILYHITDHLGSVRVVKDGTGAVLQRFDYYPFGSVSGSWSSGTDPSQPSLRYRFGGKEIAGQSVDASFVASALAGTPAAAAGTPYLDFGARLYDPRTAAWLSQDPMAEKYYGISPYAYCYNNPIRYVDLDGGDGWDTTWGYVIGGITNIIPSSSKLRDWYRPHDSKDYNRALENCDKAALAVGSFATKGGLLLTTTGGVATGVGEGMMATGGVLVVSGIGAPEGGAVAVGGAGVTAAGATATVAGVSTTAAGINLMMNASNNSSEGYERGKTGGETSYTKAGREAHTNYDPGPGYEKEVRLKPTRKRADALNREEGIVRELKPNNPRAIRRGQKQVQDYVDILNRTEHLPDGRPWQGFVDTY